MIPIAVPERLAAKHNSNRRKQNPERLLGENSGVEQHTDRKTRGLTAIDKRA